MNKNIKLGERYLRLPKLKEVRIKKYRTVPEGYRLKSVTVSCTPTGKYYASILYECEFHIEPVIPNTFLGIDYSMKELFISPEGDFAEYPGYYRQSLMRLKREQKKLSDCYGTRLKIVIA